MSKLAEGISLAVVKPAAADLTPQERQKIADELTRLDVGEVRFDNHNRLLYSTDASLYQVKPIGVVVVKDVESVGAVVKFCGERKIALLPRGGGTSLAGQCTNRAIVVDLSAHCRRLVGVDVAGASCEV